MAAAFRARGPGLCIWPGAARLRGRERCRPNRSRDIRVGAAPPSGSVPRRVCRCSQRCRTSLLSSAVDHASDLSLAVGRRAKPPALELGREPREDLAVREALAPQRAMAPSYELLRPLVEKRQHLVDEPGRLGAA